MDITNCIDPVARSDLGTKMALLVGLKPEASPSLALTVLPVYEALHTGCRFQRHVVLRAYHVFLSASECLGALRLVPTVC